jgi:predicted membrane chloride channel (bestrophin family)
MIILYREMYVFTSLSPFTLLLLLPGTTRFIITAICYGVLSGPVTVG